MAPRPLTPLAVHWLLAALLSSLPLESRALTLESHAAPSGGFASTGTFRLVTVGQPGIAAFPAANPAAFVGFAYTIPSDRSAPVIQNNMLANAVTTWFNADPGSIVDIDFFDAGGSHLSRFETKVTTDVGAAGMALEDFATVQSSAYFGAALDAFTADWALAPGTFGLMREGANYVSVRAFDGRGNFSVATSTFVVLKDTTPPSVALTAPPHGSTVAASLPDIIGAYADATSGVNLGAVQLLLDGIAVGAGVFSSSAAFVPTAPLTDGFHTAFLSVLDAAGNLSTSTSVFRVDTTSPAITIISPINGSTVATNLPLVSAAYLDAGAGVDLSSVSLVLDGIDVTMFSTMTAASISFVPVFALADGTHSFIVEAADLVGNPASVIGFFQVDTTSPIVAIITPVSDSLVPADQNPLFISTYSDGLAGIDPAAARLFLDAAEVTASAAVSASSAVFTPFSLSLGTHVFTVTVPDRVGNTTTMSSSFTAVDPATPTIVSNLSAGSFTTWFNSSASLPMIDVDFFDLGGGHLSRFETKVTTDAGGVGVPIQDFTVVQSSADFGAFTDALTADWPLPAGTFDLMQQGTNYISVRVFDQAGNFTVALSTFLIWKDTVPPTVPAGILLGGGGTGVQGAQPVTAGQTRNILWCGDPQAAALLCPATSTDSVSGLPAASVSLFFSTSGGSGLVLIASGTPNSGTFSWTTPIASSTGVVLRIVYSDKAGNVAGQNGRPFTIGQPDLDMVTGTVADRVSVLQNPTRYRLQAHVLNSGLANAPAGEDVLFTGTFPPVSCPGGGCDFNQTQAIIGGPINPGTRNNASMGLVNKPAPGTYTDAITITADADGSLPELSEANNTMPVTLFVAANAANTVTVGACSVNSNFSKVFVSFSAAVALKAGQEFPMLTSDRELELVSLHEALDAELLAIENLPPGAYTGLRLTFKTVRGVRTDNGQMVSIDLTSSFLDVPVVFSVTDGVLSGERVLVDVEKSIRAGAGGDFSFTPTLLRVTAERRSWEISLSTDFIRLGIGRSTELALTLRNTGTSTDTYRLSAASPNPDLGLATTPTVTLAPGSSETMSLLVTAPETIGNAAQIFASFEASAVTALLESTSGFFAMPAPKSASGTAEIVSDILPPRSTLDADPPVHDASPKLITPLTQLSFAAVDDAVLVGDGNGFGVARTDFSVDGASFGKFISPFMIPADGPHSIRFFSVDMVGNTEAVHVTTVTVDGTPPAAVLLSPSPDARGLDQVFGKGEVTVIATVSDIHLSTFTLEFAAGANAQSGFALIAAGTASVVSGAIARWDTTSLAGVFTLRLTATDSAGHRSTSAANVFVGEPALLLTLENAEKSKLLDKPEGVAVDPQGNIYVANSGAHQVLRFTGAGELQAAYDGFTVLQPRNDKPNEKRGSIQFEKPAGVALDASGNLYVADRNNHRITVLNSTGTVVRSLGRTNAEGRHIPGKAPLEFNHPTGVAISSSRIAVADRNNARVQVLDLAGAFLFQIRLEDMATVQDDDDEDDGQAEEDDGSKPFGVAFDPTGGIYVTDEENGRLLAFDPEGKPLFSVGNEGGALGQFNNPKGIAASALKYLYVADRGNKRVQKIDSLQRPLLAFGPSSGLEQPLGAALDAATNLYVVDRKSSRLLKYGLPAEVVTALVTAPAKRPGQAKGLIAKDRGGKVEREDKASVIVPAFALAQDIEITVSSAGVDSLGTSDRKKRMEDKGLKRASEPIEYGPEGTKFSAPVTLVLPYDAALAQAYGLGERELKVHYWNPSRNEWEPLESTVDTIQRTVSAKTDHFSLYQVLGPAIGIAAIDDFGLRDGYAFPNPSHSGSAVTFRMQPGSVDAIEVRVYDLAGRKVHSSADFRFLGVFDDGNGKGAQNTFDHVWNVSGIGSGVYTYVMTAKKAGQSDIRKTGKVGVIK